MGLTYGLIAAAAVLGLALLAVMKQVGALRSKLEVLEGDQEKLRQERRGMAEKERKASEKLEVRKQEVQQLKKDLGAHKKKAFATSEELKNLRSALKEAQENAEKAVNAKPAFADPKPPRKEKEKTAAPVSSTDSGATKAQEALEARVAELEATLEAQAQETQKLRDKQRDFEGEAKRAKAEARKAQRRAADYKKGDMVVKSRLELADDKIRHLGRQLYEAISENAALKGEVAPPKPRDFDEVRKTAEEVEKSARDTKASAPQPEVKAPASSTAPEGETKTAEASATPQAETEANKAPETSTAPEGEAKTAEASATPQAETEAKAPEASTAPDAETSAESKRSEASA